MKKSIWSSTLLLVTAISAPAWAQDDAQPDIDAGSFSKLRLGGAAYLGMATAVGDFDDEGDEAKLRFAGGGALLANYYLTRMFALTVGLGLVGQGYRIEGEMDGHDYEGKMKVLYMQIPIGAQLDISNFLIGVAVAFDIGLKGNWYLEVDGQEMEDADWGDEEWENHRRFNIAPKITLGYAIPIGPIFLVPTADFAIHLLNDRKGDAAESSERHMNIMFGIAAFFGLLPS